MGFQDYYQFALQGILILVAVFVTVTDFSHLRRRLGVALGRHAAT
jgi:hypothetical protein